MVPVNMHRDSGRPPGPFVEHPFCRTAIADQRVAMLADIILGQQRKGGEILGCPQIAGIDACVAFPVERIELDHVAYEPAKLFKLLLENDLRRVKLALRKRT